MQNILLEDIYIDNNKLSMISNMQIKKILLGNDDFNIEYNVDDNLINFDQLIEENEMFLGVERIYSLMYLNDNGEYVPLLMNEDTNKEDLNICKDMEFTVNNQDYIVSVYLNKKNSIKVNIHQKEHRVKTSCEGICVSNKILNLQLVSNSIKKIDGKIKKEAYLAKNAMIILYGQNKNEIYKYNVDKIENEKLYFNINLENIPLDKDYKFNSVLIIDDIISTVDTTTLVVDTTVLLSDEVIVDMKEESDGNQIIKYISIKINQEGLRIDVNPNLPIKANLQNVYYDKGVILEGKLNSNIDLFGHERVQVNLCLVSNDNKINQEYPLETHLSQYRVKLRDEDIALLKDSSIDAWKLFIKVYINDQEVANETITNQNKKIFSKKTRIFNENINIDRETIITEIFVPKNSNAISMVMKNIVNIEKIISVVRRDNNLKIKYRTKENIEKLIDSKDLKVDIETPNETLTQKAIKKVGKKTFVVEYHSENGERFAEDMYKKGVTVYIKSSESQSITMLSDIHNDIIYNTFWKQVQASRKYKRVVRGLYKKVLTKLPVKKDWIVYESFLGRNMSDSPKYIYEYLRNSYPGKYKHIWVFNEKRDDLPKDVVQVKRFSFEHLYYIARSKYWVNNMRQPKWFIKRNNQVFLATWHGTPLKKLVFDMNEVHSANKNYKEDFYIQSRAWDYLVSANDYSTEIFKRAFKFDNPILEEGYPRNDLMYHPNKEKIATDIKEKLGIPLDKKVILYAPTWRDDEFFKPGKYKFNLELDLRRLRKELGDEYYLVLRTHYFIANHIDVDGLEDFVYNASQYDDITELYLLADVLITDYSSVFFDYANLKRPTLFFTYDLEKYRDTLRGFYLDLQTEGPGPIVMNNDEIIEELKDFDKLTEKYKDRVESFHERFCTWDDGNASKRIAEKVIVNN